MESLQQAPATAEVGRQCCCMCGDVGFAEDLLQCPVCFRVQHTYCSKMYPKIDVGRWRCEWCLHDERKKLQETEDNPPATSKKHKRVKHAAANNMVGTKKLQCIGEGDGGDANSSDPGRRWKPKCNTQSPRRRYKLLADVLMC